MNAIGLDHFFGIATAISKEKNYDSLLTNIVKEAMRITNCDGGTLYICGKDSLNFKIMRNISLKIFKGENGEPVDNMPPVPYKKENVCACSLLEKKTINVADVNKCNKYNFSGPMRYDKITGYHTISMLVIPLENHYGDMIGVLQLINAMDEDKKVVPFRKEYVAIVESLASFAAVTITNRNYMREIKDLFESFVKAISTAIDERTPYNANHSRNMAKYGELFVQHLNKRETFLGFFDVNRTEQLIMSIYLHDIGKMVISTRIMNKETRLGYSITKVRDRFQIISLLNKVNFLEGKYDKSTYEKQNQEINETMQLIERANPAGYILEQDYQKLLLLKGKVYLDQNGEKHSWLTEEEFASITIRKGTLSPLEREIMESHVRITEHLLNEIKFSREYDKVKDWASLHHEFLDGSGYPKGLKEEEIPYEVRILTIIDIFEALTASDRPYKPPLQREEALEVLKEMAIEGKLDGRIVDMFIDSMAWKE